MAETLLELPRVRGLRLARITVDQYHRMLDAGILHDSDPIELLDGVLVYKDRSARGEDPMTIGRGHNRAVQLWIRLDPRFCSVGSHVQIQGPVTIPPDHEPEPDVVVVRGSLLDAREIPRPEEVLSVIEVSDSSLEHDRTTKLAIYARAGIPQYLIVNLVDRCVEVYEQPVPGEGRYGSRQVVPASGRVAVAAGAGGRVEVAVADLLP